jgi:hypothetical protein
MSEPAALSSLLACPRCDRAPLEASDSGYRCPGCKTEFPGVGDVPWLFAEPNARRDEWQGRWQLTLRSLERNYERLERALGRPGLLESTRQRLERLRNAQLHHAEQLKALLQPLELASLTGEYATYLALRTRMPTDQGLMTYYTNVHRDWGWGDEENEATLDIVCARLGDRSPGRAVVLGSGAGRLAYDFHQQTSAETTVGLDFNPLYSILARRIADGERIELYDFPIAPRSIPDHAVLRTLAAPERARKGLRFVLGDVHRPPFAAGAFETVLTPWLIDIVPEDFATFCARVNALLAPDGQWINLGSLSFHDADPALCYSRVECEEIVSNSGFEMIEVDETEIPYMCSPSSRHGRREDVLSWSAIKHTRTKRPERYEALPDWLVRGQEPIPISESFKVQAASTRIHAFIMSLIDGRRTLKDVAREIVAQGVMSPAEAESAIRTFLIRMYDEGRKIGD